MVTSNLPDESNETAVGAIVICRPNKDPLKTKCGVVVIYYKWYMFFRKLKGMDNIHKGYGKCEKSLEKSGKFFVRKWDPLIQCFLFYVCYNTVGLRILTPYICMVHKASSCHDSYLHVKHTADNSVLTMECTYWCDWWLHIRNHCMQQTAQFSHQIVSLLCIPAKSLQNVNSCV